MMLLRKRRAFSILEILVALVFMSFAFLPIYNMFRVGTRGTSSNAREVEATNYASDLINFMRDRSAKELSKVFKEGVGTVVTMNNDTEIMEKLRKMSNGADNTVIPPIDEEGYARSMTVSKYEAVSKTYSGRFADFIKKRTAVENYLVSVRVTYMQPGKTAPEEEVVLYTIVMD